MEDVAPTTTETNLSYELSQIGPRDTFSNWISNLYAPVVTNLWFGPSIYPSIPTRPAAEIASHLSTERGSAAVQQHFCITNQTPILIKLMLPFDNKPH